MPASLSRDAASARPIGAEPSAWVQRWSHLVAAGATVLDVACGSGRHVRYFAARGCRVTGVDRDADTLRPLEGIAELHVADIESGAWPFHDRRFDAVVVTNYLWRERLADVVACVAPGGVLLYETFSAGHERIGKPSNPKFLLQHGELLKATLPLRPIAFEEGFEEGSREGFQAAGPRFVQRIVAWCVDAGAADGRRCLLARAPAPAAKVNSRDSEDSA